MEKNPRQAKIDALLAAIEIGSDENVITTRCKGLHLADFPVILIQVCLKPKPGLKAVGKDNNDTTQVKLDENIPPTTTATTDADADAALKLKEAEEIKAQEVAKQKVAEDQDQVQIFFEVWQLSQERQGLQKWL
jgi:hypothetical protein